MTRVERMDVARCNSEVQRNHIRFIDETGVSILSVGNRADQEGPAWTYSIGLWQQYSQPEILIVL